MSENMSNLSFLAGQQSNLPKTEKPKILFLDDEERILNALRAIFRSKYEVIVSTSGREALEILRDQSIAVVVSDQRMPNMTGIEFLREAKVIAPDTLRILLTGFSDLRAIIDSVNEGEVFRFINKPWENQEIQAAVSNAVDIALATSRSKAASSASSASGIPGAGVKPVVVVKCHDEALFEQLRVEGQDDLEILHAPTQELALSLLQSKPVSVLVSSLDEDDLTQDENSIEFLKLLKQELPELLTIGMAQQTDHEKVVDLINQAKVYRYVTLPSRPSKTLFFIRSAIEQHRRHLENPVLLQQQSVEIEPQEKTQRLPEAVMSSIRSIRKIFSGDS